MSRVEKEKLPLVKERPAVIRERLRRAKPSKVSEREGVLDYRP